MRGLNLFSSKKMVHPNAPALSPGQPLGGQGVPRISRRNAGADVRREEDEIVRVCTVNIGTMVGKRREVVELLARRRVDIWCAGSQVQEQRYYFHWK